MQHFDEIPSQPPEACFEIAAVATARLAKLADGNGIQQNQLRLAQQDTQVHQIQGLVCVTLKPTVTERVIIAPPTTGKVFPSRDSIFAEIETCANTLPQDPLLVQEIVTTILARPDRGWGLDFLKISLKPTHHFSMIENCTSCNGEGTILCKTCQAQGTIPCVNCQGQGFSPCPICFGTGAYQKNDGSRVPCNRCNNSGRIPCLNCQAQGQLPCPTCQGQRKIICSNCQQSGKMARVFQTVWHAEASFALIKENLPPEITQAINKIGMPEMALQKQAEIFCTGVRTEGSRLDLSYTALLPLANAELQVAGKIVPAQIGGLQAKILSIEPFLDKCIKPGIQSLQKVSQGSFATAALIASACKYKVLRQILSGLGHQSRKAVYLKTVREYPLIFSEKYIKAAVLYAERALFSLTRIPRLQGLALGTGFSVLISGIWFLTMLRKSVSQLLHNYHLGQHILAADILVWVLCYLISLYAIRFFAAKALDKILPDLGTARDKGLPSAGAEGFWALGTTFICWFALAAIAPERANWLSALLKSVGL